MLETASHPIASAQSKVDRKRQEGPLNLSVASDRPSIVELPKSNDQVAELVSETKSEETTEKQKPVGPSPPPLLILDLNGCIVYREYVPGGPKIIKPRPHLNELFEYINSGKDDKVPNWELMIWSSAMPRNVDLMVEAIEVTKRPEQVAPLRSGRRGLSAAKNQLNDISNRLDTLSINPSKTESEEMTKKPIKRTVLDVWTRDALDLSSAQYGSKVQTTKDLRKIWDQLSWSDPSTGNKLKWGPHNTVIVDDSADKLSLQPDNLCLIEEFKGDQNDKHILSLIETLKSIRDEPNISESLKKLKEKKITS